jgi:hypothetical protein
VPDKDGFYVKSINAHGQDIRAVPLKVSDGEVVTGVTIVLGADAAQIKGRVTDAAKGTPLRGTTVVLVPAEPERWSYTSDFIVATTNMDGFFETEGAPGQYLAIVLLDGQSQSALSADFIRAHAAGAQLVSVKPQSLNQVEIISR